MLKPTFYFLSPVETVLVTKENLEEVAAWCGGHVAETESRRVAGRMDSYVWVPTPKGTKMSWAFPGMYISKRLVSSTDGGFRVTYAVIKGAYFEKNYFEDPIKAIDNTWDKANSTNTKYPERSIKEVTKKKPADPKRIAKGAGEVEEAVPWRPVP